MRPTKALISRSAIRHNLDLIRGRVGPERKILCAVKANAYGHGMIETAEAMAESGADWFGVATGTEALDLAEAELGKPILILGTLMPDDTDIRKLIDNYIRLTVCNIELAEALDIIAEKAGKKVNVHLKVDTGMGRIGVRPDDVIDFMKSVKKLKNLIWEGIFTHFPISDAEDKSFTMEQVEKFEELIKGLKKEGFSFEYHHTANSGAVIDMPDTYFNLVRPGIMLYGLYPSDEVDLNFGLKQVMTLETEIAFIKHVPAGTSISYGRTFVTERPSTIATLPIGYGDGFNRRLSNRGRAIVRGRLVPIVGRVCMDQTCIDVTDVAGVSLGDPVVLYGRQGDSEISIQSVSELLETITYEVTCWVSARVPRIMTE